MLEGKRIICKCSLSTVTTSPYNKTQNCEGHGEVRNEKQEQDVEQKEIKQSLICKCPKSMAITNKTINYQ